MTIRAIAFDMGGVIASLGTPEAHRRWERRLGLPERTLLDRIWASPVAKRALIGHVSGEEMWRRIQEAFSLSDASMAALVKDVWPNEMDHELLDYIRSLRSCFKTAIISNAYPETRQMVAEWLNGEVFDEMLFSGEEGVAKPDREIFDRALERLAVRPEEMIFVDDLPSNVAAAQSLGIRALLFRGREQIQREIERALSPEGRSTS